MELTEIILQQASIARILRELIALREAEGTSRSLEYGLLLDNVNEVLKKAQSWIQEIKQAPAADEYPTQTKEPRHPRFFTLTTRDAAARLNTGTWNIKRAVKKGLLIPVKKNGNNFFDPQQVDEVRYLFMR